MQAWFIAGATVVGLVALTRLVQLALVNRLSALADRTITTSDDLAVDLIRRVRLGFLIALYADLAIVSVMLPRDIRGFIHTVFIVACVYQAGVWGNGVIEYLIARRRADPEYNGSTATTMAALGFGARIILWSALVLLGLQNAGVNVTALVTGLGIGGIAIALAVQNILGDLFASIAIVLDRPFVIGDFIIVGDLKGSVEHIGLKTTRIRSLFGEQLVISNEALLKQSIRNYRRMQERRITFTFGVTYQTPRARVAAIAGTVREVIEQQDEGPLRPSPLPGVRGFRARVRGRVLRARARVQRLHGHPAGDQPGADGAVRAGPGGLRLPDAHPAHAGRRGRAAGGGRRAGHRRRLVTSGTVSDPSSPRGPRRRGRARPPSRRRRCRSRPP